MKQLILLFFLLSLQSTVYAQKSIVEKYGRLSVDGNYIIGEHGDTVQLRGMSFFWSQWKGEYYNKRVVQWLRDDWKCTVVRAAMGVDESGGYLHNAYEEKEKVERIVKAAIDQGIYVIIDYHSHHAHENPEEAKRFFAEMAKKYGKYPNVIYEIYNEPLQVSWTKVLKPYSTEIIEVIRSHDPHNLVICGTRQWSQMVSEAALDPVDDHNVAYALHYYAGTHKESLRNIAQRALDAGIAIFVTEFGICEASGDGELDFEEAQKWWDFLDKYKISWANWAVSDKEEAASALVFGAGWRGKWKEHQITPSGKFVREELLRKNGPIFESLEK
ncbi:glycoside hydrolase family 5 protein [Cytophagaceae bacterium ABcell3]|nr:glycoside hydrolase family 5 protein [Cytophagaceae bacterium ABcell3]